MRRRKNLREFTRAPVNLVARLISADGTVITGQAKNLSMNGLRLLTRKRLSPGTQCRVEVLLESGRESIRVLTQGEVTRRDSTGIALKFTGIELDSLDHLRKLILHNSPDTSRTEKEFESHAGLKKLK